MYYMMLTFTTLVLINTDPFYPILYITDMYMHYICFV